MRRSASLRRRETGWSRLWLFDERREFRLVGVAAHVVGVVVSRPFDHHELHRSSSCGGHGVTHRDRHEQVGGAVEDENRAVNPPDSADVIELESHEESGENAVMLGGHPACTRDRKSTRLNSSHSSISYAVFCLKKKKNKK